MPTRAMERVQSVFAAGIRPKGFVVVHEAPKLLSAPASDGRRMPRMSAVSDATKSALRMSGLALAGLATSLVVVSGALLIGLAIFLLAAAVLVPAFLVVGVAILDPILVAVTEDGLWIEIDRWYQS